MPEDAGAGGIEGGGGHAMKPTGRLERTAKRERLAPRQVAVLLEMMMASGVLVWTGHKYERNRLAHQGRQDRSPQ